MEYIAERIVKHKKEELKHHLENGDILYATK